MKITPEEMLSNNKTMLKHLQDCNDCVSEIYDSTKKIIAQNKPIENAFERFLQFRNKLNKSMGEIMDNIACLQLNAYNPEELERFNPALVKAQSVLDESIMLSRYEGYNKVLTDLNMNLKVEACALKDFAGQVKDEFDDNALFVNNFRLTFEDDPDTDLFVKFDEYYQQAQDNAEACEQLFENPLPDRQQNAIEIVSRYDQTHFLNEMIGYYKDILQMHLIDENNIDY